MANSAITGVLHGESDVGADLMLRVKSYYQATMGSLSKSTVERDTVIEKKPIPNRCTLAELHHYVNLQHEHSHNSNFNPPCVLRFEACD